MKRKLARVLSNTFCAVGIYVFFWFVYFIAAKPLSAMPQLAGVLIAFVGVAVSWKLDDLREG